MTDTKIEKKKKERRLSSQLALTIFFNAFITVCFHLKNRQSSLPFLLFIILLLLQTYKVGIVIWIWRFVFSFSQFLHTLCLYLPGAITIIPSGCYFFFHSINLTMCTCVCKSMFVLKLLAKLKILKKEFVRLYTCTMAAWKREREANREEDDKICFFLPECVYKLPVAVIVIAFSSVSPILSLLFLSVCFKP